MSDIKSHCLFFLPYFYAFLLAVLIAIIDIFPVLGVGTVLIPWSLVLFLEGNTAVAAGLLILFGLMSWIRQFAEAHLLGKFMGLHPLITLAGGYLGLRFFGFWGMLYTPIIIYVIKITVNNKRNL
jgi:predicted PurR-regulated permease PerM